MARLNVSDKAPAFGLKDQSGTTVRLSSFKGRKVLVFFYPKADTPGCTTQACGLRDVLGDIGDTDVEFGEDEEDAENVLELTKASADAPVVRATAPATVDGATLRYAYALRGPEGLEVEVVGDMTFRGGATSNISASSRTNAQMSVTSWSVTK
jgi:hypothetical protein